MIREFEERDIDAVMDIWLAANISAHSFIERTYWESAYEMVRGMLPGADLFVYEEKDVIRGFIGITERRYIAGLFVGAKYQSRGVGRKLLDHTKNHYPHLELDVFVQNEGAVRFYQRHGFEIIRTEVNEDVECEEYRMAWSA